MGSCVSSARTIPLDDIAIAILGIDNAGKTCFLRSLAGDFNFDTVPSSGLGQESFMYDDVKLKVYDLGGGPKFRSVWQRFFAEIWGFIYVVDASDTERFEESARVLKEITSHEMMKGKPYIVIANKQDLPNAVPAEKLKKTMKISKNIDVKDAAVIKVDGDKCNEGVSESTSALIGQILKKFEKIAKKRVVDMAKQEEIENKEKAEKMERIKRMREEEAKKAEANEDEKEYSKSDKENSKSDKEDSKSDKEGSKSEHEEQ
ncbi:ADP-ribosylation factor-like protein 13B [Histomonas meleagridis]|uniref:ADP-ribosylation factor-like protein 13B n=1 Tax=Histomonas meleagridis TaxID=135588 RepID=UPI0035598B0D|nr:ADP-ribosylation factor-like protein 13B [Histomonas meleagridis]KAH0806119.1 ADP-ribosylation factor-like protein 13B [Histomonas meleagridis]